MQKRYGWLPGAQTLPLVMRLCQHSVPLLFKGLPDARYWALA
jgi:hypothetical protein